MGRVDDHSIPVQLEDLPIEGMADIIMTTTTRTTTTEEQAESPPLTSPGPITTANKRNWWIPFFFVLCITAGAMIVGLSFVFINNQNNNQNNNNNANEQEVRDYLAFQQISTPQSLRSKQSPQSLAATFMTNYALPTTISSGNNRDESSMKWMETYIMAVFYYSTEGPTWAADIGFLKPNVCDWHVYVRVGPGSGSIVPYGASCDFTNGRVDALIIFKLAGVKGTLPTELALLTDMQYIILPSTELVGSIPSEYGNLSNMIQFDLQGSTFTGSTIPDSFQSMTNLNYFNIIACGLEGTIPEWIHKWTSLTALGLTENNFIGSIPTTIAKLTDLTELALDDNFLTGDLTALVDLTNLQTLYVEHNAFTQSLDETFLNKFIQLEELDISDNKFSGAVPVHLMGLESLVVMDVNDNQLTVFPDAIHPDTKLIFLAMHKNQISTTTTTTTLFPATFSHLTNLRHLDITSTNFGGEMPIVLGTLTDLRYLFLADTNFDTGPIPESYSNLTNLRDLSLKKSNRNGPIPTWMATTFDDLYLMDLDNNELTGTIPVEIFEMRNLRYLLLNRNDLQGTIPIELASATKLQVLILDHNNITGSLNPFCAATVLRNVGVIADCNGTEITCVCCTTCCNDDDPEPCNDKDRLAQYDPDWQDRYSRTGFSGYDFFTDFNMTD